MITPRTLALAVLAGAALAACDRADQTLPFDSASLEPVTRTIPASGGTLSSAAGASVQLPAGAVPAGTAVTLTPIAAPAPAGGTAASTNAFRLDPAGLALATPGSVDLRVDGTAPNAWLASVVVATAGGVVEDGSGSVDLNGGLLHGRIGSLGTVSAVIPEAAAVVRAQPLGTTLHAVSPAPAASALTGAPTRALRGDCGAPGRRCAGLVVEVSERLLALVDTAAIVYPRISGQITITGQTATGSLVAVTPLRVRLGARTTATTVHSRIVASPTPQTVVTETDGRITLTNVRVVGESGRDRGETMTTLTVQYQGAQAWIRLEHQFEAVVEGGTREPVTVAARVPLLRVQ
jgi:hypothetical protein